MMLVIICPDQRNQSVEAEIKSEGPESASVELADMIFLVSAYFFFSFFLQLISNHG